MQITRIEFDDPDDPKSACNDDAIRIRITPEGMALAMPSGGQMVHEDQIALGQMLRLAYEQGKEVGALKRDG